MQAATAYKFTAEVGEELLAGTFNLLNLIEHNLSVPSHLKLEETHRLMQGSEYEYWAILDDQKPVGLCSRNRVSAVLGTGFEFALNHNLPVTYAAEENPLIYCAEKPLLTLLQRALSRGGNVFQQDVILINASGNYLGLVPISRLSQIQTKLLALQISQQDEQQRALRETNVDLFRRINELRQSDARYRSLFESTTTSFALLNTDGSFESANLRLKELLLLPTHSDATKSFSDFVVEADQPILARALAEVQNATLPHKVIEITLTIPNRTNRIVRTCVAWIPENGLWSLALEDVTDERALQLSAHAREKRSLLESLVGGVAHELNNKLTPIIGFASLLENDTTLEQAAIYGNLIARSAQEATKIIQQLLHLSKPIQPQREYCNLQTIIQDTLTILKFRLRDADIELCSEVPPEPIELHADPGQLKQVLINLCINAIDAMQGLPTRKLTVIGRLSGDQAMVRVRDTGVGIPAVNLKRIFHPFFTTKGPQAGTGLGLSICASVIEQHGGHIDVQSKPGVGSKFTFWVPRSANHSTHETDDPINTDQTGRIELHGTVLVVEDEEVISRLVQELLRRNFDCDIELVTNGVEALERCQKEGIALIISDLRMPEMNGMDLHRRLMEMNSPLQHRFIFMSGNESAPEFRDRLIETGAPILSKPFKPSQLFEVVKSFALR